MHSLSIYTAVEEFRTGRQSAQEIVEGCLDQWRAWSRLGAITWIDESAAVEAARRADRERAASKSMGAFSGLPFVAKDNIDTVGFPTTSGISALRDFLPKSDARVVRDLRLRGALLIGKANMHELAAGGTTTNPSYGTTRNPYAQDRVPGGSSGGCGAAVAAGIVPLALGTDTAGSVRIPAAYCGVVGLRPTVFSRDEKAYSSDGLLPFSCDLDTVGPLARTVADLRFFDNLYRGSAIHRVPPLSELRFGLPIQYYWEDLDSSLRVVALEAVEKLRSGGATVVEVDVSPYVADAATGFGVVCFDLGLREDLPRFFAQHGRTWNEILSNLKARDVRELVSSVLAKTPAADAAEQAGALRTRARDRYIALCRHHRLDAMIFPTTAIPPPKIEEGGDVETSTTEVDGKSLSTNWLMIRNTMTTSYIGAPGLSLPAGLTVGGLPIGLELDGLPGQDSALLAVAQAVENTLGTLEPPRRNS